MFRTTFLALFLVFLVLENVGCESGQAAREEARVTLGELVSYEQQVDAKIAAENKFYQTSVADLQASTAQQSGLSEQVDTDTMVISYQAKFSKQGNISEDDLRGFAAGLVAQIEVDRKSFANQAAIYKDQSFLALAQLTTQKAFLETVRKGLEELQAEPSQADLASTWITFLKTTKEKYDASKPTSPAK